MTSAIVLIVLTIYALWIWTGLLVLKIGDYYAKYLKSLTTQELFAQKSTLVGCVKKLTFWPYTLHWYKKHTKTKQESNL